MSTTTAARAVGTAVHRRSVLITVGAMLLVGATGAGPIAVLLLIWAMAGWRRVHDREGSWAPDLYASAGASRRQRRAVRARAGLVESGGGTAASLLAAVIAISGPDSGWVWQFHGSEIGYQPGLTEERIWPPMLAALALLLMALVTSARIGPASVHSGDAGAMPGYGAIVVRTLVTAALIWAGVIALGAVGELLGAGPWVAIGALAAGCVRQAFVLDRALRRAVD